MLILPQVPSDAAAAELRTLLRADASELVLGLLLLTVGLVALILHVSRRGRKDLTLLAYGGFSGLYGLRLLAAQQTTGLATGLSEESLRALAAHVTYVIPIPAFGFWEQMLGRGWKSTLRLGVWATLVFAVLAVTSDSLLGLRPVLMAVNNGLVITGLILAMFHLFFRPPPGAPGLGALRLGGLMLAVFALGENLAGLGLRVWPRGHEVIGFFAFSCCLGYAVVQRVASNEKKLLAIETELEAARHIQSSILPERAPHAPGLDVTMRYVPVASVAGDFYDFFALDGKRVGILVADVSGHGIPAALIASMVKVAFSSQEEVAEDPAAVLGGMSRALFGQEPGTFITAGYAFLDLPLRTLRYAGAGHPPLLLWRERDQQVRAFRENGIVMGPFRDATYTNSEFLLEPGDRMVLYTDGVTEAESAAGAMFGEERLVAFMGANATLPAGRFADALLDALSAWSGPTAHGTHRDDVTLIVADFLG